MCNIHHLILVLGLSFHISSCKYSTLRANQWLMSVEKAMLMCLGVESMVDSFKKHELLSLEIQSSEVEDELCFSWFARVSFVQIQKYPLAHSGWLIWVSCLWMFVFSLVNEGARVLSWSGPLIVFTFHKSLNLVAQLSLVFNFICMFIIYFIEHVIYHQRELGSVVWGLTPWPQG